MQDGDPNDRRRPSLDYATRGTARVKAASRNGREPRWYELDYAHRDLLSLILFLAVVGGLLAWA